MHYSSFTPFCSSIDLSFKCPNCKSENTAERLTITMPNAEEALDDKCYLHTTYQCQCKKCKRFFNIEIFNNINIGYIKIRGVDNIKVKENFHDTYECAKIKYFLAEVQYALEAIRESNDERLQKLIYKMLYVNIITRLEVFLCETISNLIVNKKFPEMSEIFKQNLIKYSKKYIHNDPFSNIANENKDDQVILIKNKLKKLNFHQLTNIKKLYHDVIGIEFPDISSLGNKIKVRHDIIHKDQGTIEYDSVISLIDEVTNFIEDIECQATSCLLKEFQNKLNKSV